MTKELWHHNRVAIVTGGSSGIGLKIAAVLAARGAKVAMGGRQTVTAYSSLQDQGYLVGQLDVDSTDSVKQFIELVQNKLGTPGILINSAGISVHHSVSGHSDEDWNAVINTNLNGPFRMIRTCLPLMIDAGWGRIVNIASTAATTATDTHAAYCASKSGLLGLSRAVALEGAAHGVTCTTVSPTWVETEMLSSSIKKISARSGNTEAEVRSALESANPQNRLVQPDEIAELVSFLSSDLSPALTMEDIQVNAGAFW